MNGLGSEIPTEEEKLVAESVSAFTPSVFQRFTNVRRKDEQRYGEYRTKRLVIENHYAIASQFGLE